MGLTPPGTYPDGASARDGGRGRQPGDASGGAGEHAARDAQNSRFRRFVGQASLASLVPGLGMMMAGKRVLGVLLLTGAFALVGIAIYLALTSSRTQLVGLAVDPAFLAGAALGLGLLAVALLVNAVFSHHLLQPTGIRRSQRLLGAVVVTLVGSLVVTPVALGSRYAMVQHDLVRSVFTASDEGPTDTGTDEGDVSEPAPPADPWADVDRVNVLLIGSDAGAGREGTRPDTNIVASLDPATGETVLFSLPRNLEQVPFPDDSLLSAYYPSGWQGEPGDYGSELLNAVYRYVPAAHPELFTGDDDPGAAAMMLAAQGATGLPIDYYVMVDLDGFEQVVDALGGIDVMVNQRIPLESSLLPGGYCTEPTYYLEPGRQRLTGYEALWYSRVRCGGEGLENDYDRMRRQRCVIGAMVERADPLTILRRYQALAGTAQRIVSTDIPASMVPAFAELALRVQGSTITTLPFTDRVIDPASPDYEAVRQQVQEAINPSPSISGPGASPSAGASPAADDAIGATPGINPTPSPTDESDGVLDIDDVC